MTTPPFWPQTLVDYAQILAAIATAAAVIVSLWIALRKPKAELAVSADIRILITPGATQQPDPSYVMIKATNISNVSTKINNVDWCWAKGRLKNWKWAIQTLDVQDFRMQNTPLLQVLNHGDEAHFYLPMQGQFNWLEQIRTHGFFPEVITTRELLDHLCVVIYTTVGQRFPAVPHKALLDDIWTAQQQYLAASAKKPI